MLMVLVAQKFKHPSNIFKRLESLPRKAGLVILLFFLPSLSLGAGSSCQAAGEGHGSSYSYLAKGKTALVFVREQRVYKVYVDPEASGYDTHSGLLAAQHEAMLLEAFQKIIIDAGITEFRSLSTFRAEPLEPGELQQLAKERLDGRHFAAKGPLSGVLISERVRGRTLDEVLHDETIPSATRRGYYNSFVNALNKMEAFMKERPLEFPSKLTSFGTVNRNFDDWDQFYPGLGDLPYPVFIAQPKPAKEPLLDDFYIHLSLGSNIMVDQNGFLVLVDPM